MSIYEVRSFGTWRKGKKISSGEENGAYKGDSMGNLTKCTKGDESRQKYVCVCCGGKEERDR